MKINKKLLALKAHYFLTNGGSAPIAPFLPLIGRSLGFSSLVTGLAFSGVSIASVLTRVSLKSLGKKCQKLVFLGLIIVQLVSYFGVQYVPPLPGNSTTSVMCRNETFLRICSEQPISDDYLTNFTSTHLNENIFCMLTCKSDDILVQQLLKNSSESTDIWSESEESSDDFGFKNKSSPLKSGEFWRPGFTPIKVSLEATSLLYTGGCLLLKADWLAHHGQKWSNPSCDTSTESFCDFHCGEIFYDVLHTPAIKDSEVINYNQFWSFFLIVALGSAASKINAENSDSICFDLLGDNSNQMLWGSMGCGLVSIISGFAIDKLSPEGSKKDLSVAFYLSLAFLLLDLLVSTKLEDVKEEAKEENEEANQETEDQPSEAKQDMFSDIFKVMSLPIFIFTFWCILIGLYTSIVDNFLFWYLEDVVLQTEGDMSLMKTLEGLTLTVNSYLGEMPLFLLSGWLLNKVGHAHSMTLVLLAFGTRFLLYSYITNPWWTLPVGILNGITFSLYRTTTNAFCLFVPSGSKPAFHSFLSAHYDGLGISFGSSIGGYLMQSYGGSMLFWTFGLSAFAFSLVNFVVHLFLKKPKEFQDEFPEDVKDVGEEPTTQTDEDTDFKIKL